LAYNFPNIGEYISRYKITNGLRDIEIANVLTAADNSKTRGHSIK